MDSSRGLSRWSKGFKIFTQASTSSHCPWALEKMDETFNEKKRLWISGTGINWTTVDPQNNTKAYQVPPPTRTGTEQWTALFFLPDLCVRPAVQGLNDKPLGIIFFSFVILHFFSIRLDNSFLMKVSHWNWNVLMLIHFSKTLSVCEHAKSKKKKRN